MLKNKIPFNTLKPSLDSSNYVKKASDNFNKKKAEEVFLNNIVTSFPSYRFEIPGYLNDPYQVSLDFTKKSGFSGRLKNPIEVVSGLSQFANWIMDIVLDLRMDGNVQNQILFQQINSIITHTLASKNKGQLRFGIGPRGFGGTRIQILENKDNGVQIYPTIFNLSSGEASLLCLFGELLRQADNLKNNIQSHEITGIVLIDEVDKHLHIKLQKEILPLLLEIFPNVQFVVSGHEIVQVQHKTGNAVIMSAEDYESLQETLHLLSQPNFKQNFSESVAEADSGQIVSFEEVFGEAL